MNVTARLALHLIPADLESQPLLLCIDDTMVPKFGKKFEDVSILFDHAAHNGSNYLNGHCFVSLMLCVPVWNRDRISYLSVRYIRSGTFTYSQKGRSAKHDRRLSIDSDFILSDEKVGDYYMGYRRVLTNIFGTH